MYREYKNAKIQNGPIKQQQVVTRNKQTMGIQSLTINYLHNFILVIIWKGPNVCISIVIYSYQTYIYSQQCGGLVLAG